MTPLVIFIMPFAIGIAAAKAKWIAAPFPAACLIGTAGVVVLIFGILLRSLKGDLIKARLFVFIGAWFVFFFLGYLDLHLSRNNTREFSSGLITLAEQGSWHILTGQVIRSPVSTDEGTRLLVAVFRHNTPGKDIGISGYLSLLVKDVSYLDISPGDWIRFKASLRPVRNFKTPGAFDIETWWAMRRVMVTGYVKGPLDIAIIGHSNSSTAMGAARYLIESARKQLLVMIDRIFIGDSKGFAAALLVGEKSWLSPDVKEAFSRTGTSHLMAVSGLHMGLMALFTGGLIRFLLLRFQWIALRLPVKKIATLSALTNVIIYAGLAGLSPSAVRAAIMVLVFGAAYMFARPQTPMNSLAIAAWCLLLYEPLELFNISFELSFAAALFLILFSDSFKLKKDEIRTDWLTLNMARLKVFIFVNVVATLGTAPLVAWYFQRVSILSLPANMILVPLTSMLILPGLMFGALVMALSPALGAYIWRFTGYAIGFGLNIINYISAWDWAVLSMPRPGIWQIGLFYLALILSALALCGPYKIRKTSYILAFASIFVLVSIIPWPLIIPQKDAVRLYVLDVGQGLSQVVELPGRRLMVVDGGGLMGSDFDVGDRVVAPFIRTLGYSRIDIIVASHPEHDHIGGLPALIRGFAIGELWTNGDIADDTKSWKDLMKECAKKGIKRRVFSSDEAFSIKDAVIEVMTPEKCPELANTFNARSLVIMISYKGRSMLLTGDIEKGRESCLVSNGLTDTDILVMPHHGSRTANTQAFINATMPKLAIASVGWRNHLGLPKPEILARYRGIKSRILRTDKDGTITVDLKDNGTLNISSFAGSD
ncbi:MAG: DNA internalization-related competence protein ComEC/Rec2 [Dissulfurimicrobium sp.]|uniref:DNA internalization-related competence protein ComEC/Rec2 n=1 Tax=Dissulfurimicrobium sp. TaxID=2022436 RepID=UPI00404B0C56